MIGHLSVHPFLSQQRTGNLLAHLVPRGLERNSKSQESQSLLLRNTDAILVQFHFHSHS